MELLFVVVKLYTCGPGGPSLKIGGKGHLLALVYNPDPNKSVAL